MLPAALYLVATPRFRLVGFVPVVCLLLAARAVRSNQARLGRVFVVASVVVWSAMGSMLVFPLVLHLFVAGAAIGLVAPGQLNWKAAVYILVGIAGAFVGALSFGDAPLLMQYPSLNPSTLSVVAAVVFVTVVRVMDMRVLRHSPHAND